MNPNANRTPTFFLDCFQVSPNPDVDVDVACLYDELLETAHALLGIVDGNIPDDSTITHAAKFLISAARAGYQTLGGAIALCEGGKANISAEITVDRDFAQSVVSEFDAAHEFLEIAWEVMNDATRAKFTKRVKDADWILPEGSPLRHDVRAEKLRELDRVLYGEEMEGIECQRQQEKARVASAG